MARKKPEARALQSATARIYHVSCKLQTNHHKA